jgi:hypothetical protein
VLLRRLSHHLGRTNPLPLGAKNRVEIDFLSETQADALLDAESALDRAAAELGIDWRDYFLSP